MFIKRFETKKEAKKYMNMKNHVCRAAGNFKDIYVLANGPENDFAIVDLKTGIEIGSYEF